MRKIESFRKQREVLSLLSVTVKIIDQENEKEQRLEYLIAKTISESVIVTILGNKCQLSCSELSRSFIFSLIQISNFQ